ncbi:MAG: long-chain fatty acid--CoA ligase [Phycisphaeraceae bacterium]|nr:long-chain fatty acid--CoA ligase [Phycisphaeraceae bacterium]
MKLHDRIRGMLLRRPFREVAVDDQRRWRGATMLYVAAHLAKAIEAPTDKPRIGVMLPTSGLFPAALLAAWRLGRTVVPLNYLLSPEDLAFVIEDAGLDAVVTVGPMLNFTGQLPDGVTAIKMEQLEVKGLPPRTKRRPMADDEPAVILYTSGTSGRPKGVILTSGNLSSNIDQIVEWVKFDRRDVMLGVLPQFHSFGLTVLTLLPLAVGCRSVYAARFMPKRVLQLARTHRPTVLVGIPSMFNALRLAKSATRDDLSSLRFTVAGGEPLPDAVSDGFFETFGIRICEGYGLTETAPCTNWCRPDEYRAHKVGMAMPGIEERIVGENGEILGPEQDGEVRIKGPNVMPGYYNRPEETAAAFDEDGFFRTGDMGRMDADGFLSITGRIKEMLIIGGENVFPREIEEVLDAHPSVRASAVIGAPDESRGEVALAFVELIDDATFDDTSLRSHCRDRLPQFKVPREIRRLEELPRNPTGKIMRRALGADTAGID